MSANNHKELLDKALYDYCKNETNLDIEKLKYFITLDADFDKMHYAGKNGRYSISYPSIRMLCYNSDKNNLSHDMIKFLLENKVDFRSYDKENPLRNIIGLNKNITVDTILLILKYNKYEMTTITYKEISKRFSINDQIKISNHDDSFKKYFIKQQHMIDYVNDKYEYLLYEEKCDERYMNELNDVEQKLVNQDIKHMNELNDVKDKFVDQDIKYMNELNDVKDKLVDQDIKYTNELNDVERKLVNQDIKHMKELNDVKDKFVDQDIKYIGELNLVRNELINCMRRVEETKDELIEIKRYNSYILFTIVLILIITFVKYKLQVDDNTIGKLLIGN